MGGLPSDGSRLLNIQTQEHQPPETKRTIWVAHGGDEEVRHAFIECLLRKEVETAIGGGIRRGLPETDGVASWADLQKVAFLPEGVLWVAATWAQWDKKGTHWVLLQTYRRREPAHRLEPQLQGTGQTNVQELKGTRDQHHQGEQTRRFGQANQKVWSRTQQTPQHRGVHAQRFELKGHLLGGKDEEVRGRGVWGGNHQSVLTRLAQEHHRQAKWVN